MISDIVLLFLNQPDDFTHLFCDILIAFPFMGTQASGAILDAVVGVGEIAAAGFAQGVEGAVAEDAGECFGIGIFVAGKVFALFILEEVVMCHGVTSFEFVPGKFVGGRGGEGQFLAGFGVAEAKKGGPECDFAVICVGAVLPIAHQGQVSG